MFYALCEVVLEFAFELEVAVEGVGVGVTGKG